MQGGNIDGCGLVGCGVVFRLTRSSNSRWQETVVHRFLDNPGAYPYGGVISDSSGRLYGTTYGDDTKTFGSVFKIIP